MAKVVKPLYNDNPCDKTSSRCSEEVVIERVKIFVYLKFN